MQSIINQLKQRSLEKELIFKTSRSSGPGGQNVNKVNTRVELRFNIDQSQLLNEHEKHLILSKWASKISRDGFLIIVAQESRSQLTNKEAAINRFYNMLALAVTPVKKRKPTKRTKTSVVKRLENKKHLSAKKQDRRYRAL